MMPPSPPSETVGVLTERARTLIDLGRPADALPFLLQALGREPEDGRALCLLAQAHIALGNPAEAASWAQQAIRAAPEGEWGFRLLALQWLNRGRPLDALAPATEAARLAPDEPSALYVLALTQIRLSRLRDAGATAERLRQAAPDAANTHETLGLLALKQRRWQEAEAHCRHALALKPDSYYACNNLGVSLLNRPHAPWSAKSGEAVDCFHRATQMDPTDALARRNLSLALSRFLLFRGRLFLLLPLFALAYTQSPVGDCLLLLWGALIVWTVVRYCRLPPSLRALWRRTWWRDPRGF